MLGLLNKIITYIFEHHKKWEKDCIMNENINSENKKRRICLLDELRGLAVIAMVIYHIFYSMTFLFHMECAYPIMRTVYPYEPVIPIIFITICGICCTFSHNNLKRGLLVFAISAIITLATAIFIPSQAIWFGILHFLGIAILIYALAEKTNILNKIPVNAGLFVSLILYIICYNIPKGYIGFIPLFKIELPQELYSFYWLSFLGFPSADFTSGDYFPIIPNIFLFFFGIFSGKIIDNKKLPEFMYKKLCPPLDYIGKHALIIYVVHQPLIIGVLFIISCLK